MTPSTDLPAGPALACYLGRFRDLPVGPGSDRRSAVFFRIFYFRVLCLLHRMRGIKEEVLALLSCNGLPLGLLRIGQNGGISLNILLRKPSSPCHNASSLVTVLVATPQLIGNGSISSTCPIDLSTCGLILPQFTDCSFWLMWLQTDPRTPPGRSG